MDIKEFNQFTACGGCAAKLSQDLLQRVLGNLPTASDPNLLVGFDTSDDAAVYKLRDDLALIHTLDFFPPMVDDPYLFGKIAAANALSDVYAMGGEVLSALNIVAFPEGMDPAVLEEILRGGAEKVREAGGLLCGGHSIADKTPKYGLSVTGAAHPDRILRNNTCRIGDQIILTKPLGVGLITAAYGLGEAAKESYLHAVSSMETLNQYAMDTARNFRIHAATDVTGFGFLGHLNEMVTPAYSIHVTANHVPYIPGARTLAEQFLITGGGMKNRNALTGKVAFHDLDMAMEEILFDPQTSGGLLLSVHPDDADALRTALGKLDVPFLPTTVVGEVVQRGTHNIQVA
ncbi:MAG: selenide, water dikinase SelD [Oscillospiraceae bacterium]|nr:selenide, water dikinase SelD [Oscillospiraceae bacterium]